MARAKSEPTEHARLKREHTRKLNAIAKKRGITVREALAQVAGDQISQVYDSECKRRRLAPSGDVAAPAGA